MTTEPVTPFSFGQLIVPILPLWGVAWSLGILTAVSVVGLSSVAGHFLALSAFVGATASFNYALPSLLIRGFAVGRTLGRYGDLMISHQAIFELLKRLRVQFFGQFARLSHTERHKIGSGDLSLRLVKDIDVLDEFVLRFVSPYLIFLVVAGVLAVVLYWHLQALAVGVIALFVMILMVAIGAVYAGIALARAENGALVGRKTVLLNALPAMNSLLIWGKWGQIDAQIDRQEQTLLAIQQKTHRTKSLAVLIIQWLLVVMLGVVLWVGLPLVDAGGAWTLAMILGAVFAVFSFNEIALALVGEPLALGRSVVAKERLNQTLGNPTSPSILAKPLLDDNFYIKINHLSIKQPTAVFGIQGLSFEIHKSKPVIIQGVSGGGKSTLLDGIAGEIAPTGGEILLINGDNSYNFADIDWQGELGYLGQQVDIFDQSLADNLRLGKVNASDDELWAVLDLVGLKAWAGEQPQGLHTPLGEYGVAVSGGQARRIALARLLLTPKKILLLDEPFAGLDKANRERIWQVLKLRQQDGILVVVSHHDLNDDKASVLMIGEPELLG